MVREFTDDRLIFTSLDSFEIKGRGRVIVVRCPISCSRDQLHWLSSNIAAIDGTIYYVRGVESYAKAVISKDDPIGLLVLKMEDYFVIKSHWTEQDAAWHIAMLECGKLTDASKQTMSNTFQRIKDGIAVALTDPSPYIRYMANYIVNK